MKYHRLSGVYREDKDGLTRINSAEIDPMRVNYAIANPNATPSKQMFCREHGDQMIRERILAGDQYDDLVIIQALIEKGALVTS